MKPHEYMTNGNLPEVVCKLGKLSKMLDAANEFTHTITDESADNETHEIINAIKEAEELVKAAWSKRMKDHEKQMWAMFRSIHKIESVS